ncbi:hypothetical protein CANCADRAFT_20637, partial [Tortispora caseinolytica NRRL Y-17796]
SPDLSNHINDVARSRTPSKLKDMYKYYHPGIANLAAGFPHPELIPFSSIKGKVVNENAPWVSKSRKFSLINSKKEQDPLSSSLDIANFMEYTNSAGLPDLLRWCSKINTRVHKPAFKDIDVIMTNGASDGLTKAYGILLSQGDTVITDAFTFTNGFKALEQFGCEACPVASDSEGMSPASLEATLRTWEPAVNGKRPHVMYLIPVAQNPTGTTMSLKRKQQIYDIASKFDLIIIEDDPYFFIQFGGPKKTGFFDSLIPSFLNIDTDGRVIRLDTFSKMIGPGSRLGWITARSNFIQYILRATEGSTQFPSGLTQAVVLNLVTNVYGEKGWETWLEHVRDEY